MTDLQLGLAGLGAAAVLGVLVYNKVQEFKHRKLAQKMMAGDHEDVLLGRSERRRPVAEPDLPPPDEEPEIPSEYLDIEDVRREPVLGTVDMEDRDSAEIVFPDSRIDDDVDADDEAAEEDLDGAEEDGNESEFLPEPAVAAQVPPPAAAAAVPVPPVASETVMPVGEVPLALLDPRLDFVVIMELVEAVPGHQIRHAQRDAMARITKPVVWVGFNERNREWEAFGPEEQASYRRLRVGLQLADRQGPLSEADFTVFVAAMQQLSDELMAVADMTPRQGVIGKALALDRFCASVDLEIGVNLVCKGNPFSGTKIRALAEAAGMTLDDSGRFTRFDDDGRALFSLQNFESTPFTADGIKNLSTHGLTFVLDVPRVTHGERVFFQMVDLARRAAETLQGMLVDDNRQPLTEAQLDQIKREYVSKPQATMAQYGITAGSPQAQRLFS